MISGTSSHSREDIGEKVAQPSADRMQPPSTLSPLQAASIYTQSKPSPSSSAEIMRNRMAFFSVPSQPVRINAKAFLGLEPPPPSEPAEQQEGKIKDISEKSQEKEEKSTDMMAKEEQAPALTKEADSSRKRQGRREPTERAKRWRKRRKKRRVTGHVTGAAVAEKHGALPVVPIEGASTDDDEDKDLDVEFSNMGDDVVDNDQEVGLENVAASENLDESRRSAEADAGNEEHLESSSSSALQDEGEVAAMSEEHRRLEDTEETSITICDAADDLSESESEIVDELCMNDDDDNEDEDAKETASLIDGLSLIHISEPTRPY